MTTTTLPMTRPYRTRPASHAPRTLSRPQAVSGLRMPARPVTTPTTLGPSRAVYRRRRAAVAIAAGLFVFAGARAADGVVAGAAHHATNPTKVVHYQVQPGDTLWSIAHRLAPGTDPRAVVDMLVQAHGGPTIQPGDVIDWAGT